jgi:hypothetical protein
MGIEVVGDAYVPWKYEAGEDVVRVSSLTCGLLYLY